MIIRIIPAFRSSESDDNPVGCVAVLEIKVLNQWSTIKNGDERFCSTAALEKADE